MRFVQSLSDIPVIYVPVYNDRFAFFSYTHTTVQIKIHGQRQINRSPKTVADPASNEQNIQLCLNLHEKMFGYTALFSRTWRTIEPNMLGVPSTILLNGLRWTPDWEKITHTKVSITTVWTKLYGS